MPRLGPVTPEDQPQHWLVSDEQLHSSIVVCLLLLLCFSSHNDVLPPHPPTSPGTSAELIHAHFSDHLIRSHTSIHVNLFVFPLILYGRIPVFKFVCFLQLLSSIYTVCYQHVNLIPPIACKSVYKVSYRYVNLFIFCSSVCPVSYHCFLQHSL